MKYPIWLSILLIVFVPTMALAGGTATLTGADGTTMHITWQDSETLRMGTPSSPGYMIIRDGKAYSVMTTGDQPRVIEMSSMLKAMRGMAGSRGKKPQPLGEARIESVKETGETRTVAGIEGKVYQVTVTQPEGRTKTLEMVLTDNPLVVEMTQAYMGSLQAMVDTDTFDQFMASLPEGKRGVLSAENGFHLQTISAEDPPASQFELPAKPQDFGEMMQQMMRRLKPRQ